MVNSKRDKNWVYSLLWYDEINSIPRPLLVDSDWKLIISWWWWWWSSTKYTINNQTGTSYTLVADDKWKLVTMNNSSANTLTIPAESSVNYDIWTYLYIYQKWSWQTSIEWASGVVINWVASSTISKQYWLIKLIKITSDVWSISWDLITNWLLNELVWYWDFSTNWSFPDKHWNNNWTINWATYSSNWKLNWCYSFDWSNDSISLWSSLKPWNWDFTLTFWIKTTTTTQWAIFSSSDINPYFALFTRTTPVLRFDIYDWSTNPHPEWFASFNNWNWHFVTCVRNWNNFELNMDNWTEVVSIASVWTLSANSISQFWKRNTSNYYNWSICEVWYWRRALWVTDLSNLYNNWNWLSYNKFTD